MVKYLAIALVGTLWLISSMPAANALVCARGVYRAGCAGPRGAVVVRRPVYGGVYRGAYVRRPGYGCYWRAGVRICR
jgi:hypothetical protein